MRDRAAPTARRCSGPDAAPASETVADLRRGVGNQGVMRMLGAYARGVVTGSATASGANAVTEDRIVHLAPHVAWLPPAERQRIVAHEAVHAAQQSAPGPTASRPDLEAEADALAAGVVTGADLPRVGDVPQVRAGRGM